jgi:hypothetical protein
MSKRTAKAEVVRVDFDAHRHVSATMREVLGSSAFVANSNEFRLTSPTTPPEDGGMLPGMAAWKARYVAKMRAS